MSNLQEKLLIAFNSEYPQHIKTLREFFRKGKNEKWTPEDRENGRRAAHTIKGASRAVNLPEIQALSHGLELIIKNSLKDAELLPEKLELFVHSILNEIESFMHAFNKKEQTPDALPKLREILDFLSIQEKDLQGFNEILKSDEIKKAEAIKKTTLSDPDALKKKLAQVFKVECRRHIEKIRKIVELAISVNEFTHQMLDEVLRYAHTLKGGSRAADIYPIQYLSDHAETIFWKLKKKQIAFNEKMFDVVRLILDLIEDINEEGGRITNYEIFVEKIQIIHDFLEIREPVDVSRFKQNVQTEYIEDEKLLQDRLQDVIQISEDHFRRIQKTVSLIHFENQGILDSVNEINSIQDSVRGLSKEWEQKSKQYGQLLRKLEIDPNYMAMASYINFINQQVSSVSRQIRIFGKNQKKRYSTYQYLSTNLQKDIVDARTMAAQELFSGFRKMVRDIAEDEKKVVEFTISGLEVMADRVVFQYLKDPLMHILRNAVSHGIEYPQEREKKGKGKKGKISLTIFLKDQRLFIRIQDDGAGLDHRKIKEKAIKSGLIQPGHQESISEKELERLIFEPNFSTSETISESSGRGMGLSVVHQVLVRLQGDYSIKSHPLTGTCIELSVPVTLSATRILKVKAGDDIFGIPVRANNQICKFHANELKTVEGKMVFLKENRQIYAVSLANILKVREDTLITKNNLLYAVEIFFKNYSCLLIVDDIIGDQDVVIQDLPEPASDVNCISGCFINSDGTVILVLNIQALGDIIKSENGFEWTYKAVEQKSHERKNRILIVDDSVTTRTLEKTILEAYDYHVNISIDGVEALRFLNNNEIDLVITDVDMPRMDGFTLVEEIKKNERLKKLPIIIVSSLNSPEEKERGLSLGATAYIHKQKFDQKSLLETIGLIL